MQISITLSHQVAFKGTLTYINYVKLLILLYFDVFGYVFK